MPALDNLRGEPFSSKGFIPKWVGRPYILPGKMMSGNTIPLRFGDYVPQG
jgi:hypothetical protein